MLLIQESLISQHCECFLSFEELPVSHQRSVTPAPRTAASDHEIAPQCWTASNQTQVLRSEEMRWCLNVSRRSAHAGWWVGGGERCNTQQWLFTQQLPHPGPALLLHPVGTSGCFFFYFLYIYLISFLFFSRGQWISLVPAPVHSALSCVWPRLSCGARMHVHLARLWRAAHEIFTRSFA